MNNVWFTGDTHYGHAKVIEYSNRPYKDVKEMDEMLVYNYNSVVRPNDVVYHLGDFAFCDEKRAISIVKQLMGNKHLIFGNHDKRLRRSGAFCEQWNWTKDLADITINDQRIVLMHYAMLTWNKAHYGAWMLHGHSHGSLKEDSNALRTDVGVDCWDWTPVHFDQIAAKMKTKTFEPVDHHGTHKEGG